MTTEAFPPDAVFEGGRPTFTALPNWLAGKTTCHEIHVLWALQFHYPQIRPSLNRLAAITNLSKRKVMTVLADMERKGWIERQQRRAENGEHIPTVYVLRVWDGDPGAVAPLPPMAQDAQGVGHEVPKGRAHGAMGVGHEVPPPRAHGAHKEDQYKKNNHKKEIQQPPVALSDDDEMAANRQTPRQRGTNQRATGTNPRALGTNERALGINPRSDRASKNFAPTQDDIPANLLPVAHELLDFWAEKKGSRSTRAWSGLMSELCRIQQDPAGGTEVVRDQLVAGTQAAWQSVTFANWARYGQRAVSLPNGGARRYASRIDRNQQTIDEFMSFCAFADAHKAPPLTIDL